MNDLASKLATAHERNGGPLTTEEVCGNDVEEMNADQLEELSHALEKHDLVLAETGMGFAIGTDYMAVAPLVARLDDAAVDEGRVD